MEAIFDPQDRPTSTLWNTVFQNESENCDKLSQSALTNLCQTYSIPVYLYFRTKGFDPLRSEKLTQAFFIHFQNQNFTTLTLEQKQRFRKVLFSELQPYIEQQQKQTTPSELSCDHQTVVELDQNLAKMILSNPPSSDLPDEACFNHLWSSTIIHYSYIQLERDYKGKGKKVLFHAIKGVLNGELRIKGYSKVAEDLNMSEASVKTSAQRLKSRYRVKLKSLIGETLLNDVHPEEELNTLFSRI